jgi:hypothetical protein
MAELNEQYISDLRRVVVKAICEVSAERQQSPAAGQGTPSISARLKSVRCSRFC